MRFIPTCVGLGLFTLFTIPAVPLQAQSDTFEWSGRMSSGQTLEVRGIVGNIRAEGLRSDVSVKTVQGTISVITTGRAWANTVSGDIEIEMGDFSGGDLDFHTVSGDITLWLPSDFSADVDFSSLSGDFETDFDMSISSKKNRWVGSSIRGTIGGGGRDLSINTVSGDVEILRSRG